MKKALPLILVLLAVACTRVKEEEPVEDVFQRARQEWDSGDYISALRDFESTLRSVEGDDYFERIALQTGELYAVTEVSPDGRSLQYAPSGRYVLYESGPRTTPAGHIVDVEDGIREVAQLSGTGLVFSPSGESVAYLRVEETPEVAAARAELERMTASSSRDRRALTNIQRRLALLEAANSDIVLRDIASGDEKVLQAGGLLKTNLAFSADGSEVYFVGARESETAGSAIYAASGSGQPRPLTSGAGFKNNPVPVPGGRFLVCDIPSETPFPRPTEGRGGDRGAESPRRPGEASGKFGILNLAGGGIRTFDGNSPSVSADGSALVYLGRDGEDYTIQYIKLESSLAQATVKKSAERINSASLSPDGSWIAFETRYQNNGEIFCVKPDGTGEVQVSREIQPDRSPVFITGNRILAIKGERRHSRAYLYDLETQSRTRLFHNNTIRTIAPEYEWAPDPKGRRILVAADRDGDTISEERGVYLIDLQRKITKQALLDRIHAQFEAERDLRLRGAGMFRPINEEVRKVTDRVSITRIFDYEDMLFRFDSKHITRPGNKPAGDYVFSMFESFGYKPEYQRFEARNTETANILARLEGTTSPELVYVLSSHFDSNARGPGADDNSSATAVLLETARVLAGHPMPATIIFAAFTGEEAGLLGSREFVRQAEERKMRLAGALNNDMIGWTEDHRLDDTIRYTNAGIRDVQHSAAFLFSRMVTYDTRYVRSTDAQAYYDAYGDIVGGLGSYPVLGNPHYHQESDLLETVNHQLLQEAAKANAAAIMLLASSPSPVKELKAEYPGEDALRLSWAAGPEKDISAYTVVYGPEDNPAAYARTVRGTHITITDYGRKEGGRLQVAVRAVNNRGLSGWDWARLSIPMGY